MHRKRVNISHVLAGQLVGIKEVANKICHLSWIVRERTWPDDHPVKITAREVDVSLTLDLHMTRGISNSPAPPSSHVAMLSHPAEVAKLIIEAARTAPVNQ